jgi:hypothetical protein
LRTSHYDFSLLRQDLGIAHTFAEFDLDVLARSSLRVSFVRTLDAKPARYIRLRLAFRSIAPDAVVGVDPKDRNISSFEAMRTEPMLSLWERIIGLVSIKDFVFLGITKLSVHLVFGSFLVSYRAL